MTRQKFVLPTSVHEAEAQKSALLFDIKGIDLQLADEQRLADKAWVSRAKHARQLKEAQLLLLEDWLRDRVSKPSTQLILPNYEVANRLVEQDAQVLRYLTLLRKSRDLFRTLQAEDVEFDNSERSLIDEIETTLHSRQSPVLHEARGMINALRALQLKVVVLSHFVRATRDWGDLELFKKTVRQWQASGKASTSFNEQWNSVVRAFLVCGDIDYAADIVEEVNADSHRWVRSACDIAIATKRDRYLDSARRVTQALEALQRDDAALARLHLYGASRDPEDLARANLNFEEALSRTCETSKQDALRGGVVYALCHDATLEKEAVRVAQAITDTEQRIRAYCTIGHAFPDPAYVQKAVEAAWEGPPDKLRFKTFCTLARLCGSYGASDTLKLLADHPNLNAAARCYALSIAVATRTNDSPVKLKEASAAADEAFALRLNEYYEAAQPAFVWALAVRNQTDRALTLTRRIHEAHIRCRCYLIIDAVQKGTASVKDLD